MRARVRSDGGDIVLGWLTRMFALLAILTVVGFDSVSIGVSRVGASDDANSAALAASQAWQNSHDPNQAYQAAVTALGGNTSETILKQGFFIDPDGTVHLRMRRVAQTLLTHDIGPLKHFAVFVVSGSGLSTGP